MDCVGCDKCKLWGKLQVNHSFLCMNLLSTIWIAFNEFLYPEQF